MELRDKNGLTEAEFLERYRPKDYARPSVTADIAVFRRDGTGSDLLLVRRGGHPFLGKWALPGGFAEESEPVDETARRELREETHLSGVAMEQVGLFSAPGRDPRMWVMSEAYVAVLPDGAQEIASGDDAADARWFHVTAREGRGKLTLAFENDKACFRVSLREKTAAGALRAQTEYTPEDSGELAFDHAAIIASAMRRAGLLPRETVPEKP